VGGLTGSLRLGGMLAMTAGVLYAIQAVILLREPRLDQWSDSDYVAYSLFGAAVLVSLAALFELRVAESRVLGRIGALGFVVLAIGLACLAVTAGLRIASADEVLDAGFLLGFLLIAIGYLVFGLAMYRAGTLALWSAFLPLIGVLGAITLQDAHGAGLWMGFVWLLFGGALLGRRRGQQSPTTRVPG
jgi:hypothetical protein